jgi:hypothetical protein
VVLITVVLIMVVLITVRAGISYPNGYGEGGYYPHDGGTEEEKKRPARQVGIEKGKSEIRPASLVLVNSFLSLLAADPVIGFSIAGQRHVVQRLVALSIAVTCALRHHMRLWPRPRFQMAERRADYHSYTR